MNQLSLASIALLLKSSILQSSSVENPRAPPVPPSTVLLLFVLPVSMDTILMGLQLVYNARMDVLSVSALPPTARPASNRPTTCCKLQATPSPATRAPQPASSSRTTRLRRPVCSVMPAASSARRPRPTVPSVRACSTSTRPATPAAPPATSPRACSKATTPSLRASVLSVLPTARPAVSRQTTAPAASKALS